MMDNHRSMADQCIIMINRKLTDIPVFLSPPAIGVHWYSPGAEQAWLTIQTAADQHNTFSRELFFQQFSDSRLNLAERQCYLFDDEAGPIGTATAWEQAAGEFRGYGQVHWVAVVPRYQGRGLGKVLMSLVCRQLIKLGYRQAFLETSTLRPVAVKLYKQFGFKTVKIRPW